MNRRQMLFLTGAGGLAAAGLLGAGGTFRWHRSPQRTPFLTDSHLSALANTNLQRPRVLFVGNSMILRNDLPAMVQALSERDGPVLHTATAAADGARLVETLRIPAFSEVLAAGWDVIVAQDFTKTPLRVTDRWGSAWAIRKIARLDASAKLLLYPPWPAAAGNHVYRDPGRLTLRPEGPADFAARSMAHYASLGHPMVPVPLAWLDMPEAGAALYAPDGHHPNPDGTAFVAGLIWDKLKTMI